MTKIENTKEFYNKIESNDKVIVYFYTKWCPDCFVIKPYLPILEDEFTEYEFCMMDRDDDIALAKHLEIFGVPSFIVFYKGDEAGRYVDKLRKSYEQVRQFIQDTIL